MSMIRSFVRAFAALALVGGAVSCNHDAEVLGIPNPTDDIFQTYVAIGNSITAGMQASGISDATQRQSYAFLLAQQMRTRYAYPSLAATGCPAPMINWQTTARPTGAPACALRNAASATDIFNNTGVPGAGVTEVDAPTSPWHNALTTLFLGGKTQIGRAIDADPTFVTYWIGNNDALDAATVGQIGGNATLGARPLTALTTFQSNYDAAIAALQAGAPDIEGGVLIGVVQVAGAPRFFPAAAFQNAAFLGGWSTLAQGTVTVHPNCSVAPGASALVSFELLRAMQAGIHPRTVACGPTGVQLPYGELGDVFIIDTNEQATIQTRVDDYNSYIQTKANALGWGYYNPNATLVAQRTPTGCIAQVPNLTAAAAASPFGTCVSADGVHPTAAGQRLIANALIDVINNKYITTIPAVP
jgi:lysophospholipase L1-like esterase